MRISDWSSDVCSSDLAIEGEAGQFRLALFLPQQGHGETPADMRRVEQRAIGAVVDVAFGAATAFDAHDDRAIFGGKGTARLAPQFSRLADRQAFETSVDRVELIFGPDRPHAWRSEERSVGKEWVRTSYA